MLIKLRGSSLSETWSWHLHDPLAKTDMPKRVGPQEVCHPVSIPINQILTITIF